MHLHKYRRCHTLQQVALCPGWKLLGHRLGNLGEEHCSAERQNGRQVSLRVVKAWRRSRNSQLNPNGRSAIITAVFELQLKLEVGNKAEVVWDSLA